MFFSPSRQSPPQISILNPYNTKIITALSLSVSLSPSIPARPRLISIYARRAPSSASLQGPKAAVYGLPLLNLKAAGPPSSDLPLFKAAARLPSAGCVLDLDIKKRMWETSCTSLMSKKVKGTHSEDHQIHSPNWTSDGGAPYSLDRICSSTVGNKKITKIIEDLGGVVASDGSVSTQSWKDIEFLHFSLFRSLGHLIWLVKRKLQEGQICR